MPCKLQNSPHLRMLEVWRLRDEAGLLALTTASVASTRSSTCLGSFGLSASRDGSLRRELMTRCAYGDRCCSVLLAAVGRGASFAAVARARTRSPLVGASRGDGHAGSWRGLGLCRWAMATGAERLGCMGSGLDVRSTTVVAAGSSVIGCIHRSAAMGAFGLGSSGRIVLIPGKRTGEK